MVHFIQFLEIVEQMNMAKAMQMFGLRAGQVISTDDLKKKYRNLSMQYHPDRGGSVDDFNLLGAAYGYLQQFVGKPLPGSSNTSEGWPYIHVIFREIGEAFDAIEMEMQKRSKNWTFIGQTLGTVLQMGSDGFWSRECLFMKLKEAIKAVLPSIDVYQQWSQEASSLTLSIKNFQGDRDRRSFAAIKVNFHRLYGETMRLKQGV